MSTRLVQRISAGLLAQYEDVRRGIALGASQRAACLAAGLHRGTFHRIARSLEAGAGVSEWTAPADWRGQSFASEREFRSYIGRLGMASRWAGHTAVSKGSPEIERAYGREYQRRRAATEPAYRLYKLLTARLRDRQRRRGECLGVRPPRMRNKRLVLNSGLLALLTEDERRMLFPSQPGGGA